MNRSFLKDFALQVLAPILGGFLIGICTALFIGLGLAMRLPGGSVAVGFSWATTLNFTSPPGRTPRWVIFLFGAAGGFIGFALFCLVGPYIFPS